MKCYSFFLSVITIWGSKTALIFFNSILFGGKVNLVGALEKSTFKIPNSFQKSREKTINIMGKREFIIECK